MAHQSLLDGTGYGIAGGRSMIGGTAYAVSKGRAMQDGTAYEIPFKKTYTITITGTGHASYASASVNGTRYIGPATIEVEEGANLKAAAYGTSQGRISLNGATVAQGNNKSVSYSITVKSDVSVRLSRTPSTGVASVGSVSITTS